MKFCGHRDAIQVHLNEKRLCLQMAGFVGVHLGAGQHSEKSLQDYKKLAVKACKTAQSVLRAGGSALTACTETTAMLEDSPLTNAGYGSNLTWDGGVECDASVMDGSSLLYGAVGAVPGIKNPVRLATYLCERQKEGLSLGRVPPSLLVGEGARLHALKVGIVTIPTKELISVKAFRLHQHYRRKVKKFQSQLNQVICPLDTVGVVCMDSQGHMAAACSSGGIALKSSGRVGQAGVYGSGCWAQDSVGDVPAVATCTSGCGEYLIRTTMARGAAASVQNNQCAEQGLHSFMKHQFLESPFLRDVDEKLGGVIVLKYDPEQGTGEFLWSHSTKSMFVGYMSTTDEKPKCRLSRLNCLAHSGTSMVVEGTIFQCRLGTDLDQSSQQMLEEEAQHDFSMSCVAGDGSDYIPWGHDTLSTSL